VFRNAVLNANLHDISLWLVIHISLSIMHAHIIIYKKQLDSDF
jgi:hypothetical protein